MIIDLRILVDSRVVGEMLLENMVVAWCWVSPQRLLNCRKGRVPLQWKGMAITMLKPTYQIYPHSLWNSLVLCVSCCDVIGSIQLYLCSIHPPNVSSESNWGFRHIFQFVGNIGDRETNYKIPRVNKHIQDMGQFTRQLRQLPWFLQKVFVEGNKKADKCLLWTELYLPLQIHPMKPQSLMWWYLQVGPLGDDLGWMRSWRWVSMMRLAPL